MKTFSDIWEVIKKITMIILPVFGYAGVIYTLWMTVRWYENHGSMSLLLYIWFPVLCGLLALPAYLVRERNGVPQQPTERVISYDRLMAALDSLVGTEAPSTMWEQGYDECLAQVYDFVDCIAKEDGT